jgi:hypothetical protein
VSVILGTDDDELGYRPGHLNRTKNGRPYALANPDWTEAECKERGYTLKPSEPRGPSKILTRTTTYISALEDTYSLGQWQENMVVAGMVIRPQLVAQAQRIDLDSPYGEIKDELSAIALDAKEAANWKLKADLGTDFHSIADAYDSGRRNWSSLSDASKRMLAAYIASTKELMFHAIEARIINDDLGYLGKTDRLRYFVCQECPFYDGPGASNTLCVDDIKTGRTDFGRSKMALQLAAYALGKLYDPDTGIRTTLPICPHTAHVIHVPYGEGTCTVERVPLAPAIEALTDLIPRVRAFRAKTDWFTSLSLSAGQSASGLASAWTSEVPESL